MEVKIKMMVVAVVVVVESSLGLYSSFWLKFFEAKLGEFAWNGLTYRVYVEANGLQN